MKRPIILLYITILGVALHAASAVPENRFIGEWEGSIEGYHFNIVFMYDNMCNITVKTVQDGAEITVDTEGTWSCDEDIIRINGNFPKSKIKNLNRINWTSVYIFLNNDQSAFNMNITLPGAGKQTRISFAKITVPYWGMP